MVKAKVYCKLLILAACFLALRYN